MISEDIMLFFRCNSYRTSENIASSLDLKHSTVQVTLLRYVKAGKICRHKASVDSYKAGPKLVYVYYLK